MDPVSLSVGKYAAGKVAGKVMGPVGEIVSEKTGLSSAERKAKAFLTNKAHIDVSEDISDQFLRNTVKYMFYKNFIMGKTPNQAELDTMLYLLAITIHRDIIQSELDDMGKSGKEIMTKFYMKDYSFLDNQQKAEIIDKLISIDPTKRTMEELPTGEAILGAEGGGKKHGRRDKKRKYKTKKKSKKRRRRKKRS